MKWTPVKKPLKLTHFVCIFIQICNKYKLLTSQGSAATCLRCDVENITRLCNKFHTLSSSEKL